MRLETKLSLISEAELNNLNSLMSFEPTMTKIAKAIERESARRAKMRVLW